MVYTIIVHLKAKDLDSAEKIAWKLVDAATVSRKVDGWCTGTNPKDPLKFAIVERFVNEASQKYHLEVRALLSADEIFQSVLAGDRSSRAHNPYWLTFDPFVIPLSDGDLDLTRWEELPVPEPNQHSFEAGRKALQRREETKSSRRECSERRETCLEILVTRVPRVSVLVHHFSREGLMHPLLETPRRCFRAEISAPTQ
ncbi:BQ2448_3082 [Microbotryum intermedium]|uniref:BQ2448_3082 protein n=1 Tax=Microbotryum intermedium TaxID=269621 RepID=A0A238FI03_9BASI|nr:BQ2448_3082 [Microbotryum intermedium]